jgi:RNA polymerase sigma-70 factor, ECF subfamily
MNGLEEQAASAAVSTPQISSSTPGSDPVAYLSAVYRDYPGLRALILRRVHDPEVAADILQDAAVTTLEKLRRGEIAHPENLGGYLYRVALNHLRNLRRKNRTVASNAASLSNEQQLTEDPEWERVGRPQWAAAARRVLDELPAPRDRELLLRFYLNDEDKEVICQQIGLSREHFNRVIFRARNRFRELLLQHGLGKSDLLALVAVSMCVSGAAAAGHSVRQTLQASQMSAAAQSEREW